MSRLFKLSMFITSFLPLWVSIAFIDVLSIFDSAGKDVYTEIITLVCMFIANMISVAVICVAIRKVKKDDPIPHRIITASKAKGLTSEFLLAYILPFFAFEFTVWKDVVLFLVYFLTLTFLCIRNDNIYANILFEVAGYSFYECDVSNYMTPQFNNKEGPVYSRIIISRVNLCSKLGHQIDLVALNLPVCLNKTNPKA